MALVEVSARVGALIVQVAAERGVAQSELSQLTGFDPSIAVDPDARISAELENRLWDEAARLAADPFFGLHAAEALRPGAFDVVDYTIRTAATLREALHRLARYNRLIHDVAEFKLLRGVEETRVEHGFRVRDFAQSRHGAEFTLASQVVIASQLSGRALTPSRVEFRHAAPRDTSEHVRIFGSLPLFGNAHNSCVWADALLDASLPDRDPALSALFDRHAAAQLAALGPATTRYTDRVQRLLAEVLKEGPPTLKSLAKRFKLSDRSLQRRLSDEGTRFEDLLDEVRRELALRYLADARIGISEVAYLLGYSEPSPFHRAVGRWTGETPAEVRRRVTLPQ